MHQLYGNVFDMFADETGGLHFMQDHTDPRWANASDGMKQSQYQHTDNLLIFHFDGNSDVHSLDSEESPSSEEELEEPYQSDNTPTAMLDQMD